LRIALFLLIVWPTAAWLLYVPFRSVKNGYIRYRQSKVKRSQKPVWFWTYAIACGMFGVALIAASIYLLLAR
jgi:hypothetical protein